jgi:hypothetical protein
MDVENTRKAIRESINEISRPTLRPLRILDMPDEILIKIFGYVRGWQPEQPDELWFSEYGKGVHEVKNLRLTCRRFCGTSSHLLHFFRVEINTESFNRAQEIIVHPTISKGVLGIRVVPRYYEAMMAEDIVTFAQYSVSKLSNATRATEQMISLTAERYKISEEQVTELITKAWEIVDAWDDYVCGSEDSADEKVSSYQALLRPAHEDYPFQFTLQKQLLEDGSFINLIAGGFARMLSARRLEIWDLEFEGSWKKFAKGRMDQVTDNQALIDSMLLPMQWGEARLHGLLGPPAEILVKLPAAIHQSRGLLTALDIEISFPKDYTILTRSADDLLALTAGVQRLKHFKLRAQGVRNAGFWPEREANEVEHIKAFLRTLIDTNSLETLSTDFNFLWDQHSMPSSISLGPIFTFRPWPKLRRLH